MGEILVVSWIVVVMFTLIATFIAGNLFGFKFGAKERIIVREIEAPPATKLLGFDVKALLEVRRIYLERGGPAIITPESVIKIFENNGDR